MRNIKRKITLAEEVMREIITNNDFSANGVCDKWEPTEPFIFIPITITNTIDNLGQVSNLIEDWKPKTNYKEGDIVVFDNNDWRLKGNSVPTSKCETFEDGYTWNEKYKESVFGNLTFNDSKNQYEYIDNDALSQWERNIKYGLEHGDEENHEAVNHVAYFGEKTNSTIGFLKDDSLKDDDSLKGDILNYTYIDNVFYLNPTPESTAKNYTMQEADKRFIVYDNNVYFEDDYYFVNNFACLNNQLRVQFDNGVAYVLYGNKKYYGYQNESKTTWYFEYQYRTFEAVSRKGILIDDRFYKTDGDYVVIGNDYRKYKYSPDEYCYVEVDGEVLVILPKNDSDSSKVKKYDNIFDEGVEGGKKSNEYFGLVDSDKYTNGVNCSIDYEKRLFKVYRDYTEYELNYVTGETASQLSMFKLSPIYDNLGVEFDASFSISQEENTGYSGVIRPKPEDYLCLLFEEGTTNDLTYEGIYEGEDGNYELYWGNIIEKIDFYIEDGSGNINGIDIISSAGKDVNIDTKLKELTGTTGEKLSEIYSLKCKIDGVEMTFEEMLSHTNTSLKCHIVYYVGGTITRKINVNSDGNITEIEPFHISDKHHKGIEYKEDYTLIKRKKMYALSKYYKYPVYYFEMVGEPLGFEFQNRSDRWKASFRTEIPIYKLKEIKKIAKDKETTYKTAELVADSKAHFSKDFDPYRGYISSPTTRREYNLGTAYQEKIFSNIYIDRGISSAFEKHLKLQEIETLNDLENYSNGGFFSLTSVN